MLLGSELFGFAATAIWAVICAFTGAGHLWTLSALYFCGRLYYTRQVPAQFAFGEQVCDRSRSVSLRGVVEVRGPAGVRFARACSGGI